MPYVFRETQVGEARPASEFPSLTSEVIEETFAQTFEDNPVAATVRAAQLGRDYRTGTRLDAATARQRLADRGMESDITVSDAGITEDALDTLIFRKGVEKRRQEIFSQSAGGLGLGAARLGVGLATSLVDPVGVATAFIPVVGEARYLSWLGRAGGAVGRTGVRAGAGAIEGVAGAALLEPIIAGSRRYEQADYGMADSLLNVAFGGLFGAGLHSTFGAVSDGVTHYRGTEPAWRGLEKLTPDESQLVLNLRTEIERGMDTRDVARATETWSEPMRKAVERDVPKVTPAEAFHQSLPPITRELAVKQSIVQAVTGEPINVSHIVEGASARQTETPEFKRWFGTSRVVDEAGKPLVMYRGSTNENAKPYGGNLIFTTADRGFANNYAREGAMFPLYVKAERPFDASQGHGLALWKQFKEETNQPNYASQGTDRGTLPTWQVQPQLQKWLDEKRIDYDAIWFGESNRSASLAVRDMRQIKSAIGNSGRFNPESASLTDELSNVAKATEYAEKVIAREADTGTPTADALKNATEEADLAQSDLKALAERLGEDAEDAELTEILQAAANSERWARAAELATVCLVRGG